MTCYAFESCPFPFSSFLGCLVFPQIFFYVLDLILILFLRLSRADIS